jgi:GNAT superfamily N-acetyltransferase
MSGILQLPVNIVIRGPERSDQAYISSTMYRSCLGSNRAPRRRRILNDQIDRILDDKATRCLVAANASNHDKIVGWILFGAAPTVRLLHYVYVRDEERGKGIATRLVQQAWPTSNARMALTMRGPDTALFLRRPNVSFIPLEEVLR